MACVDLFVPLSFFALTVRDREGGALCQSGISMPAMWCGTHFLLPHTKIGGATDPEMISLCHAKVTEKPMKPHHVKQGCPRSKNLRGAECSDSESHNSDNELRLILYEQS